jgi:hypothetical protein
MRSYFAVRLPVHEGFLVDTAVVAEAAPEMLRLLGTLEGEMGELIE